MKKIAITGGIGTGKSFVANQFAQREFPLFDADTAAKKCYGKPEVLAWLKTYFPKSVFNAQGHLDFSRLASVVFTDNDKMQLLNNQIHPLVNADFEQWARLQNADFVLLESAIIFEIGWQALFDAVMLVTAPQSLQIQRIKNRNPQWSEMQILDRIHAQWPQERKIPLANVIIENDGSPLEPQIDSAIRYFHTL